jgi:hypothetical protein
MARIVVLIGVFLCLLGVWRGAETVRFSRAAVLVEARVDAVEELRGPPKPRQKIPLHVSFRLSNGTEHRGVTHMPMLQVVSVGDRIRVLVDPSAPQDIRLSSWSELWAQPLTYLVCGLLIVVLGGVLRVRGMR